MSIPFAIDPKRDLVLDRLIDAAPEKVYACWTRPELIRQWFAPRPWSIASVDSDLRPGGASTITMRSPEGEEFPNPGVYLEVVPNEKLVFTDAYGADWTPAAEPFFTAIVLFQNEGGKTRYIAIARHWSEDKRKMHEDMGFHTGWGQCADQLEELAKTL